ncbi:MAG TPA: Gfo/Idh/MocA family oxidoreductase [Tepidisphaeraceae bacterium]|jgi:predicted dehydrogenase
MNDALPVAVVGCGRMGRLHARVFSQMPRVKLVGVYDANEESAQDTAEEYGTVATSMEALLEQAKAVVIAVPTTFHLATATPFLERGIACLIEKPLAGNSNEARQIADTAARHNAVVQVGHIERFNPAVRAMLELKIVPGFMEVTRISPLSFRSIDVGVVLDVMIHDIDIVLQLANSPLVSVDAVGVSVIGDAEDICNVRLKFENGCVANLTASRLSMKTERRLRAFSSDTYVSLDYQKKYGLAIRKSGNVDKVRDVVRQIRAGEIEDLSQVNYTELVDVQELSIDDVEPLRAELEAFVDSVTQGKPPVVSAADGLAAVEVAERIVKAMAKAAV